MKNAITRICKLIKRKIGRFIIPIYMSKGNFEKSWIIHYNADSVYKFHNYKEISFLWEKWITGNKKNNSGDYFRFLQFILNVKYVLNRGILGDFAELGVYKGNSAAILAHFARISGRRMHCFDTFEGFDEADIQGIDDEQKSLFRDTSLEYVKSIVGEESVTFIKGRFPDSLNEIEIMNDSKYAIVSLDADLYEPIKSGLDYFYPKLSEGGMIFVHDYSSGYWEGCAKAVDEFMSNHIGASIVLMPDKSGTAIITKNLG